MKSPSVPTPYGVLHLSVRRIGDVVRLTVGGEIETPNRHPSVLGESIWLEYQLNPSAGWYHVNLDGEPWVETPAMTVSPTTREIQAVVDRWLGDHRTDVRDYAIAAFNAERGRVRRKLEKVIAVATSELQAVEEFVARVANEV